MDWFAVRHVVKNRDAYEERVTLWHSQDADEAIRSAEAEAAEYVSLWEEAVVLPLFQSFRLDGPPSSGSEAFSLIRRSDLAADDYLSAFFDTGSELQQDTE
jgi:hypothetical protein